MNRQSNRLVISFIMAVVIFLQTGSIRAAVISVEKTTDGVQLGLPSGSIRLQVWSDRIIRVTRSSTGELPETKSLSVISQPFRTKWTLIEATNLVILKTGSLQVQVDRQTGCIGFYDLEGNPILQERADAGDSSANAAGVRQSFALDSSEGIYGLGQHQGGIWNYRGTTVHLQQMNKEVAVPVLVSSKGYGVLWDNPAITEVDAGKTSAGILSWTSEAGKAVDYYFMYGPDIDGVIADYRDLTGAAPMFGKWVFGLWQCKEHYASQEELMDVAGWYRKHHVPLDGIIQDWLYWTPNPWGSHEFDTNRYPDPAKMMRDLHAENIHAIISVWPKFDVDSPNANELRLAGALYPQVIPYVYPPGKGQWYDPFNPVARKIYWQQISRQLFADGLDGWWLDASEPELSGNWGEFRDFKTAAGPGATVFNAYPLMQTTSVFAGQRAESSQKRVFILTRSAYAGQQRNAAVTWSGDIQGDWDTFAKQIPAGLNFVASGIPYWNTDTGGFFGGDPADPKYTELFTRWFQFSSFCPVFRVHGTGKPKEMWRFDDDTQKILINYDRLRYHLLPYIYSVSWQVTSLGYTMMRPLVFDFRTDTNVFKIQDQYLFGPALLACPVTKPGETTRGVYLPAAATWFDFWTGKTYAGGQTITAASPLETIPLFVRAGSIIPYGPAIEYATEKVDPIELRVYRGADGAFTLYEDEGDNYNYQQGAYAVIPLKWDEARQTLTIGQREGGFPGMLIHRTFNIVWVSPGHGVNVPSTTNADVTVQYSGYTTNILAGN